MKMSGADIDYEQWLECQEYEWNILKQSCQFRAWIVASAGETDRDLAWTQLAQKSGVYNII